MIRFAFNSHFLYEYENSVFFELIFKEKIRHFNKFQLALFKKLRTLSDKLYFESNESDLKIIIKNHTRDLVDLYYVTNSDEILNIPGSDFYEVLSHYEDMFSRQFDIQYENIIKPFVLKSS
ncbi:hypothetical protein HOK00_02925 [bacterium]|nr:hypothetical protein [bacterium]